MVVMPLLCSGWVWLTPSMMMSAVEFRVPTAVKFVLSTAAYAPPPTRITPGVR